MGLCVLLSALVGRFTAVGLVFTAVDSVFTAVDLVFTAVVVNRGKPAFPTPEATEWRR